MSRARQGALLGSAISTAIVGTCLAVIAVLPRRGGPDVTNPEKYEAYFDSQMLRPFLWLAAALLFVIAFLCFLAWLSRQEVRQ
jgi:hypothetical protein